jgi:hypothetical protein
MIVLSVNYEQYSDKVKEKRKQKKEKYMELKMNGPHTWNYKDNVCDMKSNRKREKNKVAKTEVIYLAHSSNKPTIRNTFFPFFQTR